ncbi:heme-binding protein [Belnapia sp. T18]|uniref:Heme-binding protein n=1 Tax=Belnapia arida TaxID=2804533 RepID=A0ABS1TVG3_9PROT|nr:heme-binding protein [Belnapia arida]MBL6076423.1 heme-binding protein [Belnapia arida]
MLGRLLSAASGLLLGAYSVVGVRSGTEEPRFTVVERVGEVEIRDYAPRVAAETLVEADSEEAARREGFRRLAGYIFGGNRGRTRIEMTAPVAQGSARIAMTAPVGQAAAPGGWAIRFFLPAEIASAEAAPVPEDGRVAILTIPGERVAVLGYAGVPSAEAAAAARARLLAALGAGPWRTEGEIFDWFYDPPWTLPPLRRNEAVVRVSRRTGG